MAVFNDGFEAPALTTEEINAHIEEGRQLRAAEMRRVFRVAGRAVANGLVASVATVRHALHLDGRRTA